MISIKVADNLPSGCVPDGLLDIEDNDFGSLGLPLCSVAAATVAERAALVELYNATGGSDRTENTNWISDAPLNQWYAVTTNSEGRVTSIQLGINGLAGPIPAALANLSQLETLLLRDNQLTGPIPPSWGTCPA